MKTIKKMSLLLLIMLVAGCGKRESVPQISLDEVKKGIVDRLDFRAKTIQNYTCDLQTKIVMKSERGDRTSEMSLKLFMNSEGQSQTEFVKGHRAGNELSKKEYDELERRRRDPDRRGADQQDEEKQLFDIKKYIPELKLVSADEVDKIKTYKLEAEPAEENSRFKKLTFWVDQSNFDIVKIVGEQRTRSSSDLGEMTEMYKSVGPESLTMKSMSTSRTVRTFNTPRGEMTMDMTTEKSYSNYHFNVEMDEASFGKVEK